MVSSPNDHAAELVALARAGDVAAFSRLMEAHQPRLMGQALAFCGEEQLAQDIVQETMIEAWKSLHRYDGSCRLFTWLRQHRRALGWFARRLPLATAEQLSSSPRYETTTADENELLDAAESELLRAMVAALPARHRDVVRQGPPIERLAINREWNVSGCFASTFLQVDICLFAVSKWIGTAIAWSVRRVFSRSAPQSPRLPP